jgi:hypothetical protein
MNAKIKHLDQFDLLCEKRDPFRKKAAGILPEPKKDKQGRDIWLVSDLDEIVAFGWSTKMSVLMPVTKEILDEQTEVVKEATERYKDAVVLFRASTKNDVSSAKAAASSVEESVIRMKKAYDSAVSRLTAPDFKEAIDNAERLAAALVAIEKLTETKVSFAVFGAKKES